MESSGEFHFICIRQECSLIIKRHKSRVDIYTHTQVERERDGIFLGLEKISWCRQT